MPRSKSRKKKGSGKNASLVKRNLQYYIGSIAQWTIQWNPETTMFGETIGSVEISHRTPIKAPTATMIWDELAKPLMFKLQFLYRI